MAVREVFISRKSLKTKKKKRIYSPKLLSSTSSKDVQTARLEFLPGRIWPPDLMFDWISKRWLSKENETQVKLHFGTQTPGLKQSVEFVGAGFHTFLIYG